MLEHEDKIYPIHNVHINVLLCLRDPLMIAICHTHRPEMLLYLLGIFDIDHIQYGVADHTYGYELKTDPRKRIKWHFIQKPHAKFWLFTQIFS